MNSFFEIHAGSGGVDAQDWVSILFKMYTSWFKKHKFKYDVISSVEGDISGLKSVSLKVSGKYSYGWLKYECGVHRLVRKSPFDMNNKRHTSFASVFVYPENEDYLKIKLNESDLKIDTFKASGAGGQHVNKTNSAVRIRHIPTNLIVQCQSDRSQHKNKVYAIKQLKLKINTLNLINKKKSKEVFEKKKSDISWGNQIRSYFLDKSFIKDLRTNFERNDVSIVLNGDLDPFVFSILKLKYKDYE